MKTSAIFFILTILACTNIKKDVWVEYRTKQFIPVLLKKEISTKGKFVIANPNEKYNSSDNLIDSLPNKKLKFVANSKNLWRLAYTQGGFGKYNVVIQCRIEKDSVFDMKYWETIYNFNNNKEFEDLVINRKAKQKI